MDIRSAESASLAAKRLELERTQPVAKRPKGTAEDRVAADAGVEEETLKNRSKTPEDTDEAEIAPPDVEDQSAPAPSDGSNPEEHILDVRV
jgi:hypothetical protein